MLQQPRGLQQIPAAPAPAPWRRRATRLGICLRSFRFVFDAFRAALGVLDVFKKYFRSKAVVREVVAQAYNSGGQIALRRVRGGRAVRPLRHSFATLLVVVAVAG